MRIFFLLKGLQCLICYAVVVIILTTNKFCGKSQLDELLSRDDSVCTKILHEKMRLKTVHNSSAVSSSSTAVVADAKDKNILLIAVMSTFDSSQRLELYNLSEQTEGRLSPIVPVEEENATDANYTFHWQSDWETTTPADQEVNKTLVVSSVSKRSLKKESFSCLLVELADFLCFKWDATYHPSACDAVSGIAVFPLLNFVQLIFLLYTMASVFCRLTPPYEITDFIRTAVNFALSGFGCAAFVVILVNWERSWSDVDLLPQVPTSWYLAIVFAFINFLSFIGEFFFGHLLYTRFRIVTGVGEYGPKAGGIGSEVSPQRSNRGYHKSRDYKVVSDGDFSGR